MINFNLLEDYLIKIGNKALSKRFGFLLDKIGVDTKKLKRLIDYKYVPLECSIKPKGKKDKKWRIIENVAIWRAWKHSKTKRVISDKCRKRLCQKLDVFWDTLVVGWCYVRSTTKAITLAMVQSSSKSKLETYQKMEKKCVWAIEYAEHEDQWRGLWLL